ncbi:hypothetical protein DL98DRAFT_591457 [Cadophora sp. DSE1049]|nr:hypothetical protein DL98DRAFT_591457 [Cadophora sp. DSE1049]
MVKGLDMPEFDPFPVREQLSGAATVYSGPQTTTLPHLAGEWKGTGMDMILAQTRAGYDSACMVYGRNEALKYHQYATSNSFLISTYEDFKKSRRRLRNLEDDAKEASQKLRDELNEKWSANHPSPVSPNVPAEADDSTDSNNYDYSDEEDVNNQLLAEYWTSLPTNNQYNYSVQIPATDNVYAPPSASFQEINQDESFVQIPAPSYVIFPANDEDDPLVQVSTANNGYTSPNGITFPLVTPP